jgi:hypothetical protein
MYGEHMAGTAPAVWIVENTNPPSHLFSVSQGAIAFSSSPSIDTLQKMKAARLSSNTEARRLFTYIKGKHYR